MQSSLIAVETYVAQGRYSEAIALCEQSIGTQPAQLMYYWYLGLAHLLHGEEAEAQAVWYAAITTIDPSAVEAELEQLAQLLISEAARQMQTGNPAQAETLYLQVLELNASPAVYVQLGYTVAVQGRYEEAIAHWQTAIELDAACAVAYRQQGEVWQALGQLSEAIAAYHAALALQPDWQTHLRLGYCLGQQQQWQAALAQFNQAIQLNPDSTAAYGDRAWVRLQQSEQATADFQIALQHSGFAPAYYAWVETLREQQNTTVTLERNYRLLKVLCNHRSTFLEIKAELEKPLAQTAIAQSQTTDQSSIDHSIDHYLEQPYPELVQSTRSASSSTQYFDTTQDWITKVQPQNANYHALDPEVVVPLSLPKTVDSVHFSFRFGQAVRVPETFVATIPDGQFYLSTDQTCTAIITHRHLLADLSPDFPLLSPGHPDKHPSYHAIFATDILPPIAHCDGTVAVLSGLANTMYFHWMFDVLPRFQLLQRSGIDLDQIDYFLIQDHLPFQQETLARLNIPASKRLSAAAYPHVQATQLIVPSFPGSPAWMQPWVCNWLQQVFVQPAIDLKLGDRLYITRQQTRDRRIINETEVIDLLSLLGFRCIALESLSVAEQAAALAHASVVIAPHGGGLTNIAFCQPGTTIIEIFSPRYVYPCYWYVSNLIGLDYYYITGSLPAGLYLQQVLYPNSRVEDIFVDLADLKAVLQKANVQ